MNQIEQRDVPNFPGYRVSSDGCVWSCKEAGGTGRLTSKYRLKKPTVGPYGHRYLYLHLHGRAFHFQVGHLVLLAFVGPCPPEMECCHNNGNPADNRVENLRWDTPSENRQDSIRHGTQVHGSKCGLARLNEKQVKIIHALRDDGWTYQDIGRVFGVSKGAVGNIIRQRTWKHIKLPERSRASELEAIGAKVVELAPHEWRQVAEAK